MKTGMMTVHGRTVKTINRKHNQLNIYLKKAEFISAFFRYAKTDRYHLSSHPRISDRNADGYQEICQLVTHSTVHGNSSCAAWKHGNRTCPRGLMLSKFYKSFLIFKRTQCCNNSNFHYLCSRIGSE